MSKAILDHVGNSSVRTQVPELRPGFTVRVHQRIKEGEKERTQIFEGLVIAISSGSGVNKTFTVRKVVDGVGVEKLYPFFSPNIQKIEVVKEGQVRRAKLYFMRERTGKSARLREQMMSEVGMIGSEPVAETVEEELVAEETAPEAEAPVVAEETAPEAEAPVAEEPAAEEASAPAEEKAEYEANPHTTKR